MISLGFQVATAISTGDVTMARNLGQRRWSAGEQNAIRNACDKWGVSPESFGVSPRFNPATFTNNPAMDALRAHLAL